VHSNSPTTESKVYSLSQVARSIKKALERATANKSWLVKAEILSISDGLGEKTVFVDLVEEADGRQNAKMRGVIWAGNGQRILGELGEEAKNILKPGREVVFSARIQFHERYGLALHIDRIDLRFMLGELERRKQITTARLKEMGAFEWNRRMPLPDLPQRIALVGSRGTSGFRDFATKITEHPKLFRVGVEVFQSSVQGVSAAEELARGIHAAEAAKPDLIVLVRGGGGKLDLDAYNDFDLCLAIARCSVPVWTGIGHESDLVVADLVAHTAWKTPTEVAVGVLARFESAALALSEMKAGVANAANLWLTERQRELDEHWETVGWASRQVLARHRLELQGLHRLLRIQAPALLNRQKQAIREIKTALTRSGNFAVEQTTRELRHSQQRIQRAATQQLAERSTLLAHYRRTLNAIGPERTLARGFMLLEKDGRIISRVADVQEGERLQIKARDGALDVTVNRVTSRGSSS
jgi:exodeoxyribonuclease VII large subunit